MTHQIYQTEGIVLKRKDFGEADCFFYIFAEEFGMITAVAKGARLEKSKLRYGLSLFSYGSFALISSKDFWRIIDAKDIKIIPLNSMGEKISVFADLANFLVRMIKGEEKNDSLWREIKNFLFAFHNGNIGENQFKNLLVQATARILDGLGYMENVPRTKHQTLSAINKAVKESML